MGNKSKKVLVTGGAGFIGSHLCERLLELGYKVKVFIRYNSRNSWGWLEESPYKDKMQIMAGDVRNFDSVKAAVKDTQIVFHLAALVGIPYSYCSPDSYVETNIRGTVNILQAARELGVKKVIHTSTSEIYGTAKTIPIDEQHPINPQSPYAASKIAADLMALSFYRCFDLPVTIVRPFNTYGPRQSARAIIPTIITQILSGKKIIKLGTLRPTRDFTYVKDIVNGFIKAADNPNSTSEIINLGSNFEISVEALLKLISGIMETKVKVISDMERKRPSKSEVLRLWADNKKAQRMLNWKPQYSLEEGLKETIDWFKRSTGLYKSHIYNV